MKGLLFIIVLAVFAYTLGTAFRETPEHMLTETEKVQRFLADFTFNKPSEITVLYDNQRVDNKTRETIKTLILKTDEEYLPKSPKVPDTFDNVITLLKNSVPSHDFGEQTGVEGGYFQWLTKNSTWTVSSIETSNGHYSRWERRTDVYQVTNDL